jgi:outer membrane protein assembly factor BamB
MFVLNGRPAKAQAPQPRPVVDPTQRPELDNFAGVSLPSDRAISRAIGRAGERLNAGEYHEALAFLQGILERDEDSFIERVGNERGQLGLKATVRKMIGELPSAGIDSYELLQGPAARKQLEAALRDGNRDGIANVARRYFHTAAGYEAALILAQLEADQGHRLAAAQLYQDLISAPRAAARFEPQLSIAAALNQLAAGHSDEAANLVRSVSEQHPNAEISIGGKNVMLPGSGNALTWLTTIAGTIKTGTVAGSDWLTLHGDPSRNVQSPGGKPHLRPRWEARVVYEPAIEAYLNSRSNDYLQRNAASIPCARPIAVGDLVMMRTPRNVVAVDWRTGKRIWETRDESELEGDDGPADPNGVIGDSDQIGPKDKQLEDRVWEDALAASLSSDGSRVFTVRGLPATRDVDNFPFQMNMAFNRGVMETPTAANQLAAYDLATQGKLLWELDGSRTAGPLAGGFFLGAPVAIDNSLFVMVEIRSALYLIALNPATGQIEWQQQLLDLEQGILLDPIRRRAGATPSYSGGILVCPTGASVAVAVDVVKRELAWVYRYTREAPTNVEARQFWQQQQLQNQLVKPNDKWIDSAAVIADGHVLLTPPESGELHCVDLQSGKLLWKRRRGEALFVAGVDRGVVLLVGSQSVQGLRLSDGAPAWKQESIALPAGALTAGQGYFSEGNYYLPLTTGQIATFEMASGQLSSDLASKSDTTLGNLICYRGSILSQSPFVLDKFEQLDLLQKRTEATLAQNPDNTNALRELAEIKGSAGEKKEAVRLLKRAMELAPDDALTQEMLVELLLDQLEADYAENRADVPVVAKLIRRRDEQIRLLRIDAAGLDAAGQSMAAWDAYLRLADFTAEEPAYLRMDDRYAVRSDRWIAGKLASIWSKASSQDQKALAENISARRPDLSRQHTAADMRHYLAHLGGLPGADEVRLALARFLAEHDHVQEAELQALQLLSAEDGSATSQAAEKILSQINAKVDAQTAGNVKWPRGRVESEEIPVGRPSPRERQPMRPQFDRQAMYRLLRMEQNYKSKSPETQWLIAMDGSEIVGRNSLGEDIYRLAIDPATLSRQIREPGHVHGVSLGHLLYLIVSGRVLAIDYRQFSGAADGDLLWPASGANSDETTQSLPRLTPLGVASRTSRPPVYHSYSGRRRIAGSGGAAGGSLGPVSPNGVVFQDSDALNCVDPLTGAILWMRTDIPVGCELFGDDEFVFAADFSKHTTYVLRVADGQLMGQRDLPQPEWLMTSGRNIAQLGFNSSEKNRAWVVTVTDIWSQAILYKAEYSPAVRISAVEPNLTAILDPNGTFHVLNVETGKLVVDQKLEPLNDLQAIQTLRSGDDLFLFVTGQLQTPNKPIGLPVDYPLIDGPVHAFNLTTGKPLWPSPAIVRNRGLMLQQPSDIPFLVFAERQSPRDASTPNLPIRVLCLDKRTGQTVYRKDSLLDAPVPRFRVRGEVDTRPTVALETSAGKILLTMTDRPRPPKPPTNDDLEAPREIAERGLRALGQRFSNALQKALQKPSNGPNQRPARPQPQLAPNVAPPVPANPAEKQKPPQTDDD